MAINVKLVLNNTIELENFDSLDAAITRMRTIQKKEIKPHIPKEQASRVKFAFLSLRIYYTGDNGKTWEDSLNYHGSKTIHL